MNSLTLSTSDSLAKLARKGPKVTAILGFAAKDRIILASDSQMTTPDGIKLKMRKIHAVRFQHLDAMALVAIAGTVDSAEEFLEKFGLLAEDARGRGSMVIPDCAEAAMKQTREGMIAGLNYSTIQKETLDRRVEDRYCRIILGYYHEKQPFIRHLDFLGAKAIKAQQPFVTVGSGAPMVGAVLSDFDLASLEKHEAIGVAVHAIQAAKRADLHCSGTCQLGYIEKDWRLFDILSESSAKSFEAASDKINEQMRGELAKSMAAQTKDVLIDFLNLDE